MLERNLDKYICIEDTGNNLAWIITKYLTTAFIVVLISEVAKRNDKLGAIIGALPLITFLALIWLYLEDQSREKISNHAWYTFWYVIPTLPMFFAFPFIFKFIGFWPTLLICIGITAVSFFILSLLTNQFGIDLM